MRKAQVLQYVYERNAYVSNAEVADVFQETQSAAGAVLVKLHRQGLVQRAYGPDGRVFSWISQRGIERLKFWEALEQQEQADVEEQEVVEVRPPEERLDDQQLDDDGEASQDEEPDEPGEQPDGAPSLARFFPKR